MLVKDLVWTTPSDHVAFVNACCGSLSRRSGPREVVPDQDDQNNFSAAPMGVGASSAAPPPRASGGLAFDRGATAPRSNDFVSSGLPFDRGATAPRSNDFVSPMSGPLWAEGPLLRECELVLNT